MGLMDSMKDAMDTVRKFELKSEMALEELYELVRGEATLNEDGEPKLKKGLLGKNITFPKVSRVIPTLTVKGNLVTLKKVQDTSKTSMGVGGMSFAMDKDLKGKNGVKTMDAGTEYFKKIADGVGKILADK